MGLVHSHLRTEKAMRTSDEVFEVIKASKIIAIIRGISEDKIIDTCKAIIAGGIQCIEVTFNQSSPHCNEETAALIKLLNDELGDQICLGAGTVMTVAQIDAAVEAGASYIISPNFNKEIVKHTVELGILSIPGAMTPSEIVDSYQAGASIVKVFPVDDLGLSYIKSVKAPISHIPMAAVGGVDESNIAEYFACGIQVVGLGIGLIDNVLVNENRFDELTAKAKRFVALAEASS